MICLVAANWSELGRFVRLGGLQAILLIVALAALHPALSPTARSLVLLLASMLLGALLALVGQTWQTGADPWQLFALWAALMVCWAVAACSVVVWLAWGAIANVALALWAQTLADADVWRALLAFTAFNIFALAMWETAWRRLGWLRHSAGPRVIASWLLGVLACYTVLHSIGEPILALRGKAGIALACWAVAASGIAFYYLRARRDLAMLALVLVTVIGVLTVHIALWLDWGGGMAPTQVGVLALLVLAQGALSARWLRRLSARSAT